jgi:hypothetical protein
MTYEEMAETYDEKWIYIVNCEFDPFHKLLSGIPVVLADRTFEGANEGVYNQFDIPSFIPRCDLNFKSEPITLGLFPPKIEGMRLSGKSN